MVTNEHIPCDIYYAFLSGHLGDMKHLGLIPPKCTTDRSLNLVVSYLTLSVIVGLANDCLFKCITCRIFRFLILEIYVMERPLCRETYLPLLISPPSPLWNVTVFWLEKQNKQIHTHTHTYKTGRNQLVISINSNCSVSKIGGLLTSSHKKVQKL